MKDKAAREGQGLGQPYHRDRQRQVFIRDDTARILAADHFFRYAADRNGDQGQEKRDCSLAPDRRQHHKAPCQREPHKGPDGSGHYRAETGTESDGYPFD